MTTINQEIIKQLHTQEGYISGENLSKRLGVSRNAIWKQIEALRSLGYEIEATPRLGYRLVSTPNQLTPGEMRLNLHTQFIGQEIVTPTTVSSTNDVAKDMVKKGAAEGLTVVAQVQTQGRGRRGREWYSGEGGLYLSIYLKPNLPPQEASKLTLLAAIVMIEVLRNDYHIAAEIKWPNDIFVGTKKICGILTELRADPEAIHYLILGIGLNVNQTAKDWPEQVQEIATSMQLETGKEVNLKAVFVRVLETVEKQYLRLQNGMLTDLIANVKANSCLLGKEVKILTKAGESYGKAVDILDDGSLVIKRSTGQLEKLWAADVSVRL